MLIHVETRFAFLSNPKSASTSIETWLGRTPGMASIHGHPRFKHTNFRTFVRLMHAYGEPVDDYEVVCIARHPLEKARSWFRYRQVVRRNPARYLGDRTFAEHIGQILDQHDAGRREFESLNLPFVRDDTMAVGVGRVFPYERIDSAADYLRGRFGAAEPLPRLNASHQVDTSLSPELTAAFHRAFAEEIAWYESLG